MNHYLATNAKEYSTKDGKFFAKPRHDYVFQFGKGELDITGSTMDLLMFITPFVDVDGRVLISLEEVRRALTMQHKVYYNSLEEARQKGFLYQLNGVYYSRFHISVGNETKGLKYQKLVQEYISPTVLGYSKNLKRLFYYFASFTRMGDKKKVTIENLYKNKLHVNPFGVSYFDTFADLAEAMLTLIKNDQIEVQLLLDEEANVGPILSSDMDNLEDTFYSFFDSKDGKKNRTSSLKREKHKIKVRMTDRVVNNGLLVHADENEFRAFFNAYDACWEEISQDMKNYIFDYKNELFQLLGETGLAIYRKSIQTYLKENHTTVLNHNRNKKLANYIMDFYIFNEIKNILFGAALHENVMYQQVKFSYASNSNVRYMQPTHLLANGYYIEVSMIPTLLDFYLRRGSTTHLVQLDVLLEMNQLKYEKYELCSTWWTRLKQDVHSIYNRNFNAFSKNMSFTEWKKQVRQWADLGILAVEEKYGLAVEQLYQQLNKANVRPNGDEGDTRLAPVPLFDWLND